MSIIAASVVQELGIMHLVTSIEYYKIVLSVITQTLGRIQCLMIIMVVDTNNYDLLLGLDFIIKIAVIVNVEKGMIQVGQGIGNDIQMFFLNMVNML
jgi:hypothetical protein